MLSLSEYEKDNAEMRNIKDEVKDKAREIVDLQDKVRVCEERIVSLQESEASLKQQIQDLEQDERLQQQKQQELLQFSSKLTENNVASKSRVSELQSKVDHLLQERADIRDNFLKSEKDFQNKIKQLEDTASAYMSKYDEIQDQLEQKSKAVNELSTQLEESQEESRVLKKKNAAQIKDLQRQLRHTTG